MGATEPGPHLLNFKYSKSMWAYCTCAGTLNTFCESDCSEVQKSQTLTSHICWLLSDWVNNLK